jgi:hypothetical protein
LKIVGSAQTNTTMTEEDAGLEGAVADDADAEYVRGVCERDIVGAGTALARSVPLRRMLLTAPAPAPRQAAAALAYTRCALPATHLLPIPARAITRHNSAIPRFDS